jgi:hypothetical protein
MAYNFLPYEKKRYVNRKSYRSDRFFGKGHRGRRTKLSERGVEDGAQYRFDLREGYQGACEQWEDHIVWIDLQGFVPAG